METETIILPWIDSSFRSDLIRVFKKLYFYLNINRQTDMRRADVMTLQAFLQIN